MALQNCANDGGKFIIKEYKKKAQGPFNCGD